MFSGHPEKVDTVILILQRGKLRLYKKHWVTQGYTALMSPGTCSRPGIHRETSRSLSYKDPSSLPFHRDKTEAETNRGNMTSSPLWSMGILCALKISCPSNRTSVPSSEPQY